jgi:hypothetical protein
LTVEGSTTTINSTTLAVEDLQIELGKVATPTNLTANGGGISLAGTTNKTITWSNALGAWVSSENFDVSGTGTYMIAGDTVLSHSSLGATVATSSLTSVGHLTSLNVAWLGVANSTISYVNSAASNGDIVLSPKGTGSVNVDNSTIINVNAPTNGTDAANRTYVDTTVASAPLAISLNTGTLTDAQIASTYLNVVFPVGEHANNTVCRAICTNSSSVVTIKNYLLDTGTSTWIFQYNY